MTSNHTTAHDAGKWHGLSFPTRLFGTAHIVLGAYPFTSGLFNAIVNAGNLK